MGRHGKTAGFASSIQYPSRLEHLELPHKLDIVNPPEKRRVHIHIRGITTIVRIHLSSYNVRQPRPFHSCVLLRSPVQIIRAFWTRHWKLRVLNLPSAPLRTNPLVNWQRSFGTVPEHGRAGRTLLKARRAGSTRTSHSEQRSTWTLSSNHGRRSHFASAASRV